MSHEPSIGTYHMIHIRTEVLINHHTEVLYSTFCRRVVQLPTNAAMHRRVATR